MKRRKKEGYKKIQEEKKGRGTKYRIKERGIQKGKEQRGSDIKKRKKSDIERKERK